MPVPIIPSEPLSGEISGAGVDMSVALSEALPLLGIEENDDMEPSLAELYGWMTDEVDEYARRVGGFVHLDASLPILDGVRDYALPADHVLTLYVFLDDDALSPAVQREIDALSADPEADTQDVPDHWLQGLVGEDVIRVYPTPTASSAGNFRIIERYRPADVTEAAPTLLIPDVLEDAMALSMVAEARRRESDIRMPEAAEAIDRVLQLYRATAQALWGSG